MVMASVVMASVVMASVVTASAPAAELVDALVMVWSSGEGALYGRCPSQTTVPAKGRRSPAEVAGAGTPRPGRVCVPAVAVTSVWMPVRGTVPQHRTKE
ncbi:hypothetical protein GCM10022140_33690 [Rhodococcus aetherivorans]